MLTPLRSIMAVFDIVVNSDQLEAGERKLDTFVEKLKGLGAAFAAFGIVKSLASFGEQVAQGARAAEFGAARIGMQVDEYQKVSQVAENYGVTVEALNTSMGMLIRHLSDAGGVMGDFKSRGGMAKEALHNLNIDAAQFKGKSIAEILPILADGFKKVQDPVERTAIALRLFGRSGSGGGLALLPLLAQGGAELRRQFAAALPVFEELTIKSADEATVAGKQLDRVWHNLIYNSFGRAVLDTFTVAARKLTDVVLAIRDLVKYSELGKGVLITLGVTLVTAAGIAIAAWWPVLAPILAIVAAFAALSLAVDDFIVFMKDGDSIIGDFFDELLGPGGATKAREAIQGMWEDLKSFLKDFSSKEWTGVIEGVKDLIKDIKDDIKAIKEIFIWLENHTKWLDDVAHFLGGGSHDIRATKTVQEALTSPTFQPADVAPPPIIGPPTAVQLAAYGPNTFPVGTPVPGQQFTIVGAIDSGELAHKVKRTVDQHYNEKTDKILRDAFAGAQ